MRKYIGAYMYTMPRLKIIIFLQSIIQIYHQQVC